jgi:SAM-dependent methyltransferase
MLDKLFHFFDDTGERPPLQKTFEQINSDLQFAYQHVSKSSKDKSILDYGCGGGYGTELLSRFTKKSVIGYDIDVLSIVTANGFYNKTPNLSFVTSIPDHKFDIIVSFQVIEHLTPKELVKYFKNLHSHLNPKGKIYIATPNKNITSYKLKTPIFAHHIKEYDPKEFFDIIQDNFSSVNVFGQIDINTKNKVAKGKFSYKALSSLPAKVKLIRFLSQFKPIRYLTAKIPQDLKNLLLRQTARMTTKQLLVTDPVLIDNSYILIAECSA